MKTLRLTFAAALLAAALSVLTLYAVIDPLSGTWTGDWGPSAFDRNQVTVELVWDGTKLTGTVNPGSQPVELKRATFDAKTNAVHFEADATSRSGAAIHYVIDGKVEGDNITGTWSHDSRKGDFKITRK